MKVEVRSDQDLISVFPKTVLDGSNFRNEESR